METNEKNNPDGISCGNCGAPVSKSDTKCPECGFLIPPDRPDAMDRIGDMLTRGKDEALRRTKILQLKYEIGNLQKDISSRLRALSEIVYEQCRDVRTSYVFIDENIDKLKAVDAEILRKETEEMEMGSAGGDAGGLWNKLKASAAKYAGLAKVKLDLSLLRDKKESVFIVMGKLIHAKLSECEPLLANGKGAKMIIDEIYALDGKIGALEKEIKQIAEGGK